MSDDKKTVTGVDEFKKIDDQQRKQALIDLLITFKENAKQVLLLKYRTECLMKEIGYSEKEMKAIIDWINNHPEVALTEADKRETKESQKRKIQHSREKALETMTIKCSGNVGMGTSTPDCAIPFYTNPTSDCEEINTIVKSC